MQPTFVFFLRGIQMQPPDLIPAMLLALVLVTPASNTLDLAKKKANINISWTHAI